jgi:GNAT superfamily N-acetyltransferase
MSLPVPSSVTEVRVIPVDPRVRTTVARWCLEEWADEFPDDTVQTYLDLFALADRDPDSLPVVLMSADDDGTPTGTATLVDDDELPDATESGPWLAAVFVRPDLRGRGLGGALVAAAEREALRLGFADLYLYTSDATDWYRTRGWEHVRTAVLRQTPVTVMHRRLGESPPTKGSR